MTLTVRQVSQLKRVLLCCGLLPLAIYVWRAVQDALGANPIEALTRGSGDWALYSLTLTLLITPLRRLTGQHWLQALRRMLGLFAFLYACLHLVTFVWFDHFFDLSEIWRDVWKRPFITVGFLAFTLLVPLAITSTHAMQRRLGRYWSRLHRLVYIVAIFALIHFWWMRAGKQNFGEPILFSLMILLLLAERIFRPIQRWIRARTGLVDSRDGGSR